MFGHYLQRQCIYHFELLNVVAEKSLLVRKEFASVVFLQKLIKVWCVVTREKILLKLKKRSKIAETYFK